MSRNLEVRRGKISDECFLKYLLIAQQRKKELAESCDTLSLNART